MGANSFSLFSTARSTLQRLRARVQQTPDAAADLNTAIELIQGLWEELQEQSELLAAERQRHAEFFEYAPEAYLITEPQGDVREANRAARELLAVRPDEVEQASLVDFIPGPERAAFNRRLIAARGHPEGEAERWAGHLLGRTGEHWPVEFHVRPIKVRRKNAHGLCWLIRRT